VPILPIFARVVAMVLPVVANLVTVVLPILALLAPIAFGKLIGTLTVTNAAVTGESVVKLVASLACGKLAGAGPAIAKTGKRVCTIADAIADRTGRDTGTKGRQG
jgi:hypothetical protein